MLRDVANYFEMILSILIQTYRYLYTIDSTCIFNPYFVQFIKVDVCNF